MLNLPKKICTNLFGWHFKKRHFNPESQDDICGVGVTVKIIGESIFKLLMWCGNGTNIREKVMALWNLTYFALHKGIFEIPIYGDSKVLTH